MKKYLFLLQRHRLAMLLITLTIFGVSVGITFLQPFAYRSSFALLVIEKEGSLDGYAAAKSAERLSLSLSQIMYTASFADQVYQRVRQAGFGQDAVIFSADEQVRRQEWKRHVETRVLPDVGMLKISVYHPDRNKATLLANALAVVLTEQGPDYLGGQNVQLRTVDFPLTSKRPARPNIPLNLLAGLLLGATGAFAYVILQHKLRVYGFVHERTQDAIPTAFDTPAWHAPFAASLQEKQHPVNQDVSAPAYTQWQPEPAYDAAQATPAVPDVPHLPQTPDNLPVVPENTAAEFPAAAEENLYNADDERLQHWYDTHPHSDELGAPHNPQQMPSMKLQPEYAGENSVWQMP